MNITYLIGTIGAVAVMLFGMIQAEGGIEPSQLGMFGDASSVLIVIGCTIFVLLASFPIKTIVSIPKHFGIMLNTKKHNPMVYIEQLEELAQVARKNGLLALEEIANQQTDPFYKQAIMLIVDANDPDRVRSILENDIECMSARHDAVAGLYDKGSAMAPAFGMVGTLIGLIKMLNSLDMDSSSGGSSSIGPAMGVAMITTLYGCVLAHMIFSPISSNLRSRDEEEVLCKMIIVEGIMSIQAGENPKAIKEKLVTFLEQKQRGKALGTEEGGGKGKKGK